MSTPASMEDRPIRSKQRKSKFAMVPVSEAIHTILQVAQRLEITRVPLMASLGHIAAEDVHARDPLPPFDASIMDGYAVVAEDGVGEFEVVGRVLAGSGEEVEISPGKVAYITTGAKMPRGANAVVKVEDTEDGQLGPNGEEITVKINQGVAPNKSIRPTGSDIALGEVVVGQGKRIGAAEVGLFATVGVTEVPVFRRPIVAVMSTGDELVESNTPEIVGSRIRDSNRPSLISSLREQGLEVIDAGIVVDLAATLRIAILDTLGRCDILVTSGGVSMGDADLLKPILEELGTVHFGRLMMKPGKPTTFASLTLNGKQKLFFGLPGNPVSCLVCKSLLVDPAIKKLQGVELEQCMHPEMLVTLTTDIKLDPERPEYHRAIVSWDSASNKAVAQSTGNQISSRLLSMASANALLCIPRADGFLPRGARVTALMLGPLPAPPLNLGYHTHAQDQQAPTHDHAHSHSHSHGHTHGHGGHTHSHDHEHSDPHTHDHSHSHSDTERRSHDHSHSHALQHDHSHSHSHGERGVRHDHGHSHSRTESNQEHSHEHKHVISDPASAPTKGAFVADGLEISTAVLVMSDRAHAHVYDDQSGPAIWEQLTSSDLPLTFTLAGTTIVPDEPDAIASAVLHYTDNLKVDLVISTGGTGFGPRDITPETIRPLLHREAPGVAMALLQEGLKHTPLAVLSRPVVGTRGNTLIVTLPGSVKAIKENMRALQPLLPRIMTLLKTGTCVH